MPFPWRDDDKENAEPTDIFCSQFSNEAWAETKIKQLSVLHLGEDNMSVLVLCLNGQILRSLATSPPLIQKAQGFLQKLADAILQNDSVPEVVLSCALGLFFRRAADILLATQIKKDLPDSSIVTASCALCAMALTNMQPVFTRLPGQYKALASVEMLEASALLRVNLSLHGTEDELAILLRSQQKLAETVWQVANLKDPVPLELFRGNHTEKPLSDDMIQQCATELWGMDSSSDFLRRLTWLLKFEPSIQKVMLSAPWASILPPAPAQKGASQQITSMDIQIFLLMTSSWSSSLQEDEPDPLFPSSIVQVQPVTKDQLECWKALSHAMESKTAIDIATEAKVNCVLDVCRLKRPPQGRRLTYTVFKFLSSSSVAEYEHWATMYANRLYDLLMGVDMPTGRGAFHLFPLNELEPDVEEEEKMHEEVSIYLSRAATSRGEFQYAISRLEGFTSLPAKKALLFAYEQSAKSCGHEEKKQLENGPIATLKAEIAVLENGHQKKQKSNEVPQSVAPVLIKPSPIKNGAKIASASPNTSAEFSTPARRRVSCGTSMGINASTTMNSSVLDDSFQSVQSHNTSMSFVSAQEGLEDRTPTATPQPPFGVSPVPRRPANNTSVTFSPAASSAIGLSVSQIPSQRIEHDVHMSYLHMLEQLQSKLKIECAENLKKMETANEESKSYVKSLQESLSPPRAVQQQTTSPVHNSARLTALESKFRGVQNGGIGIASASPQQNVFQPRPQVPFNSAGAAATLSGQVPSFPVQQPPQQQQQQLAGFGLLTPQQQLALAKQNPAAFWSSGASVATSASPLTNPLLMQAQQQHPMFSGLTAGRPSPNVSMPSASSSTFMAGQQSQSFAKSPVTAGPTVALNNQNQTTPLRPPAPSTNNTATPPTPEQIAASALQAIQKSKLQSTFGVQSTPKSTIVAAPKTSGCAHPGETGFCGGCMSDEKIDKIFDILDYLADEWDDEDEE